MITPADRNGILGSAHVESFIQPVGKPFFIKRVTDYYAKKRGAGGDIVRRNVDSTLVQYFEVIQNVGGDLPDGDRSPCSVLSHRSIYGDQSA